MMGGGENKAVFITLAISVSGVVAIFLATRAPGALAGLAPMFLVLAPVLVIVALRNWERGIQIILVVVIIEGALRKWFLPSASELVYFYKDVLMAATLIGYIRKRRKRPFVIQRRLRVLFIVLGVFLLYTALSLGLAVETHPLIGLLGLKAYCLYIPLAFITVRAFPDKERLIGFLKWYALIVLPVAGVGVMQFLDTNQQSAINRYAIGEQVPGQVAGIATFSTSAGSYFVRITSTFSYVTGLSVYLPIMFALLLAMSSLYAKRGLSRGSKILYYSALGATVVTAFMTGSRGAVLSMVVVAVIFYLFTSGRQTVRRLQQIAVVGVILFIAFTSIFPQAYDAFYNRTFGGEERVTEGWERMTNSLSLPITEASYAGLFGYGIGLTQNGVPALMKRLGMADQGNPIPIGFEGEPGRVTLELGIVGFVLYTLLRLILLITVFRIAFVIRDRESKILAFAATAALVMPLVAGGAVATHTLNVYQWFLVGVVFALYNAERLQIRGKNFELRISNCESGTPIRNSQFEIRNS
ncbi:MAG TPA: O-antigen polymerase [Blastocatellia bacterium]|nr:O-antigen polymerase [Blastocatellia bacterium]